MSDTFPIDRDIEIPPKSSKRTGVYSRVLRTLVRLDVGDSFYVSPDEAQVQHMQGALGHVARRYPERTFCRRAYGPGNRIWRIK